METIPSPMKNETLISHELLHHDVNDAFFSKRFVFASKYVAHKVYEALYKQNKRKLMSFLAASYHTGPVAVLCIYLFEQ